MMAQEGWEQDENMGPLQPEECKVTNMCWCSEERTFEGNLRVQLQAMAKKSPARLREQEAGPCLPPGERF